MIDKAQEILENKFGYPSFRPLQKEIIANILEKKDTLVIMPTGGGKSLCYQIPALVFDGLTVVVSPLISLMKDQVEQLTELGISAVVLNSSLSPDEYRKNVQSVLGNKVKLLYVAPETLLLERTLDMLSKVRIDSVTVDEAHCISEWGHDFRPVYREIAGLRSRFKEAVLVALTATATPRVQEDIVTNLKMKMAVKFVASFNRKNLYLQVSPKYNSLYQTLDFLENYKGKSGIIYCFSRNQVDELYEELNERGFSVKPYHAGLPDEVRKENQELFIRDDVSIIVATIAFGMGINKPNVRFVIHYDLPKNIESYYQEIGRAGRDGLRAHCLLLFSYGDIRKINYFIDQKEDKERRIAKLHLDALVRYAESYGCRRIPLLNYFGERYEVTNCGMCDNCNSEAKDLVDITIEAQKFMSCMVRTGEVFGMAHIIDVLRGSENHKVLSKNHHNLSTYGIGKDLAKEQWMNICRQLIQKNLIVKDLEFGSLKVAPTGYKVLKGEKIVEGRLEEEKPKYISKKETTLDYDTLLFEELRKERKKIADRMRVPPYVIFSDKTLIELAYYVPQSISEMSGIFGIGSVKLKKYGNQFLKIIQKYVLKNKIQRKIRERTSAPSNSANKNSR